MFDPTRIAIVLVLAVVFSFCLGVIANQIYDKVKK